MPPISGYRKPGTTGNFDVDTFLSGKTGMTAKKIFFLPGDVVWKRLPVLGLIWFGPVS